MRWAALVAVALIAAGALYWRSRAPAPAPVPSATPAASASPGELDALAEDGRALLSAPAPALRGMRLARRLRRARAAGQAAETTRAAWTQVHADSRWVVAWVDAGLKHEQGDHEREHTSYREALALFEPTLENPDGPGDRVFVWGQLRYDALSCPRCPGDKRTALARALRDSALETRYSAALDRAALARPAAAPALDEAATALDDPELIQEDAGDRARLLRDTAHSPMLGAATDLLEIDFFNANSYRWAPEPGAGKKETTRRELTALHALRQLGSTQWEKQSKVLETMIGYAVDGLSDQARDLSELGKVPLDVAEVRRTLAPQLAILSQLQGKAQPLIEHALSERFAPLLRVKLVRAVANLEHLARRAWPKRPARLSAALAAVADRADQRWVLDIHTARGLHDQGDHAREVALYVQSFREVERRYLENLGPAAIPEPALRAWMELRATVARGCSRRAEPQLQTPIRAALAASRFPRLSELIAAHPARANELRKLEEEEGSRK